MSKNNFPLYVTSEIGKLKTVLLHRPGKEIENLIPNLLKRLLFDDIPYLKIAQEEHDAFAKILKDHGVEVLYLEDLAAQSIREQRIRQSLIEAFLEEGRVYGEGMKDALRKYFEEFNNKELIEKMMMGIRKKDIPKVKIRSLTDVVDPQYPFLMDPMPNLYFTRDPFSTIGTGITLNHMRTETRNRETIFAKYIFENHPRFKDENIKIWFNRNEKSSLEGGDELVLSNKVIAIGISQRTDAVSIEKFAKNIFKDRQSFETILAFNIPKKRAFMHLDTVFTMVDYDKFTIHPEIEGPLQVFSIKKGQGDQLKMEEENATLEDTLKKYLGLKKVTLIGCAGRDRIDAAREQWNDGSNTLAIAPGEVIVYARNYVTNRILQEQGVKTYIMPSSELSRGRGGPRCMSMPLIRESL
ncbi:MAG: arginine deiminase [Marinisporobacter sp.]|jgi:arginine deiminase|nr:arginine deiminase [Marinisporobacter sp.]